MSLRCVISRPVLSVGLSSNLNALGNDSLTIARLFALNRILDCENVLAALFPIFKVRATTLRLPRIRIDGIPLYLAPRVDCDGGKRKLFEADGFFEAKP